jgi:hypothetical protein
MSPDCMLYLEERKKWKEVAREFNKKSKKEMGI